MEARLLAVAGPLEGSEFILGDGEFGIGRDRGNQAHVEDGSASRRHSVIVREGEYFRVRDLGSLNGTSVNNIPVKDRVLANGDTIRVGHSLFLFLDGTATEGGAAAAAQLDRGDLVVGQTLLLKQDQALYLNPEKVASAFPGNARIARDLEILLRAAREIPSVRGATRVEERTLDLVLEAIPAERAAIVLRGDEGQEFTPVSSRSRNEARGQNDEISRTVVERAVREVAALMSNDVLDRRFRPSESLVRQGVKALMAAPMVVFEETIGVIYVDSSDTAARFAQEDLELLTGLAALAAVALDNTLHLRNLEGENRQLAAELNLRHNMVGESAAMRAVLEFISKVAQTGSTILLRGESGTGKELVARAIHQNSRRARKPFVAINCAALTETLLESELFGHEKGAFTGAVAQKKGKLEEAQGGTVFLDEIGELAPVLQAKLLRVLQEREFERVGGTRPIKADIRLLAATNRDLEDAVQQGTFRQDLYYRLNVVSLTAPPLRERKDDVPLLANYFAQKHARNVCRRITGISAEALSLMLNYDWPGNVRELENAVERAVVLGSTDTILPEDLPESLLEAGQPAGVGFHGALKDAKKQIVLDALQQTQGNYAEAARLLGLHPSNLHRLIRSLGLRAQLKQAPPRL